MLQTILYLFETDVPEVRR